MKQASINVCSTFNYCFYLFRHRILYLQTTSITVESRALTSTPKLKKPTTSNSIPQADRQWHINIKIDLISQLAIRYHFYIGMHLEFLPCRWHGERSVECDRLAERRCELTRRNRDDPYYLFSLITLVILGRDSLIVTAMCNLQYTLHFTPFELR